MNTKPTPEALVAARERYKKTVQEADDVQMTNNYVLLGLCIAEIQMERREKLLSLAVNKRIAAAVELAELEAAK